RPGPRGSLMWRLIAALLVLARPILARRQNHLLGRRREVGGAGAMTRALVMAATSGLVDHVRSSFTLPAGGAGWRGPMSRLPWASGLPFLSVHSRAPQAHLCSRCTSQSSADRP